MPVCPKCGKSFSSDQALCYHLNKKYKCGTWKCEKCNTPFDTKHKLKIHMMCCEQDHVFDDIPSINILTKIYAKSKILFYELDSMDVIHTVNNFIDFFGFSKSDLIGKNISSFVQTIDDEKYHVTKSGDMINIKQYQVDNICIMYPIN